MVFQGTYSEYKLNQQVEEESRTAVPVEVQTYQPNTRAKQNPNPGSSNQVRKRQKRLAEIEIEISGLEEQVDLISHQLENPPDDADKVQQLGQEYVRLQDLLEALLNEWTDLSQLCSE